jgi:NAD(P)-dependent dehydrogenase (short-subunit alcohol dehydrogenase family)
MTSTFSGRVALVAGGTGGLGRAVSRAFLEEGARVVVTYRRQEEFDLLKGEAGGDGARLDGQRADVTDEAAATELMDGIFARHGRLDFLVNAVGGYVGGVKLWELETKVFDQMLDLNLRSGYALSRAAVRVMLRQGHGAIVNVASKAALDHAAGQAAYAASIEGRLKGESTS